MRRSHAVAAAALVGAMMGAGQAGAVTATVTGDEDTPVPLSTAAPISIRNVNARVVVSLDAAETSLRRTSVVVDATGVAASSTATCFSGSAVPSSTHFVTYRGNATYTVVVRLYATADTQCATPTQELRFPFTIAAGASVSAPPSALLIRKPESFRIEQFALPVNANPGSPLHEIRFARNATVGADGGIVGSSESAFLDRAAGTASFSFRTPGRYTIVARVGVGGAYSPWSAPTFVDAIAPFDLETLRFTDSRGPIYALAGRTREALATGVVRLAIAPGASGGKFRSIGRAKIGRGGTFAAKFSLAKIGVYRIRVTYAGSRLVRKGSEVQSFRIRRTFGLG